MTAAQWSEIPSLIPPDAPHLTITGGEPFLEYKDLIPLLSYIDRAYPHTPLLILTNGRILSLKSIYRQLEPLITGAYCFAVPIHAADEELHDRITQSKGSYHQTMTALKLLKNTPAKLEIRIVGHQHNASQINRVFEMLVDSDLRISEINLIAMEMTGCAARNRNQLWIDYDKLVNASYQGIQYAVHNGVPVGLYNFPLCMVPKEYWPLAKKSITPSKVRYGEECKNCTEADSCGGMFYSTLELGLCKIKVFGR